MKKNNNQNRANLFSYFLFFAFILLVIYFYGTMNRQVHQLTFNEFVVAAENSEIEEITISPRSNVANYRITGTKENYESNEIFSLTIPLSDRTLDRIMDLADEHEFAVTTSADRSGIMAALLTGILPLMIMIGLLFWIFTRQLNNGNKSFDFGKSKAKLNPDTEGANFNSVAGLTEEKEEVQELIDFLKSPKKFQKMGARIPKGVLLVGPPGTGKTLLAKAVAGEANVPFYFISGSDFVELFVGIGASRVRDMFQQAKQNAPCLIFIDEIDAVGRQRGTGLGGGHDEREQTLNQLLTEMDGFGSNSGIIIIAATNRPDVLDPALLRPGRFDRQVMVNLPDAKAREQILKVHAKNKIFTKTVTLKHIAARTPGFSGADLENVLNESALLAVRRNKEAISMKEIDEGIDRVMAGPAKVTKKITDKEKNRVAIHEAGHVILGLKLENAKDVHKVTIIPRGHAMGYALMLPKEETYIATKKELEDMITGYMGGRAAEELKLDDISAGAHNDIEEATKIARRMVTEFGMSDLGPMQLESRQGDVFLGRDYNKTKNFSDTVAFEIDQEVRKIIEKSHKRALQVIKKNENLLMLIAESLIKHETLTKEQIEYLAEHGEMPKAEMTLKELKAMAKEKGIKGYTKMTEDELRKELDI